MALQWNLIDTPMADNEGRMRIPTESELIAITIGLLAVESVPYSELSRGVLRLTSANFDRVANVLMNQLPMFRDVFGGEQEVRQRLAELTGIAVTDA